MLVKRERDGKVNGMSSYAGSLNLDATVVRAATATAATTAEPARAGLIEEVREFERAWGVAYIERDTAALDEILAADYTFTDPLGGVTDKRQNLDYIRSGLFRIEDTHSRNVCVRLYGETAVVTALSIFKASYKGVKVQGRYQYTDVLVRRQGRWYAVASQATLAGRGLLFLLFGRFCGDRLNSLAALPRKIKQLLAAKHPPRQL
jgi:ketosteroid isomerase-like protein